MQTRDTETRERSRIGRRIGRWTASIMLLAVPTLGGTQVLGQVEGLSYSFQPTVDYYRWGSELGLEDAALYGGRLGFNFGRTMSLEGFYLARSGVETNLAPEFFPAESDPQFVNQDVDLSNYGANVVLNLSRGRVIPFLSGGGGIFKFDPGRGPSFEEIGVQVGGGLRIAVSQRVNATFGVRSTHFRLNRFQLAPSEEAGKDLQTDPESDDFRNSVAVTAGLDVKLGGAASPGDTEVDLALRSRYRSGLGGASWPVQAFIGQLNYSDELQLDDHDLLGVRTGVDLGRLIGLRKFYWHGMANDFGDTEPVQGYGGEVTFSLNAGLGAQPYLVGGVGVIDYLDAFRDPMGERRDDQTALIAGGGLRFTLADRFRVDVSARDHLISDRDFRDVINVDELTNNWMYAAGLSFSLGGKSDNVTRRQRARRGPRADRYRCEPTRTSADADSETRCRADA